MAFKRTNTNKFKKALKDFTGKLVLVVSLLIFGVPAFAGKSKQKLSAAVCVLLAVTIFGCSGFTVNKYYIIKASGENTQTSQPVASVTATTIPTGNQDVLSQLSPNQNKVNYPDGMLDKYKTIYALNRDVIGWIKVPNTSIDTLVTQGSDNYHYLYNNFYGEYTGAGNVFLDYRDKYNGLSQNTIIYGHSAAEKDQEFCDLNKYKNPGFFIKNPTIQFGTLFADYEWKIFAVFISSTVGSDDNGYFFYYIVPEIGNSKFNGYLNQVNQRSFYNTGVDVKYTDKILTLSTCSHDNDFSGHAVNSRLVVMARLLRKGESKEIDAANVKNRPDFRRPQVWYNHFGLKNPYINSERWFS